MMNPQRSLETMISRTTSRPFRFKFSLLFIGITGVIAYMNSLEDCRRGLPIDSAYGIGLLLLILLGLEWFEQNRFQESPAPLIALLLLTVRVALIEGIVALDCSENALYLYAMVPYSAYFALGSRASMTTSVFYVLLVMWRTGGAGNELLGFTFVMLFVPLIAYIIRKDDETRERTESLLADLEVSHLKLQAYTGQVAELSAAEERNRLARDIHDSLGHYLTAVNIQLEKALLYQERSPQEATQAIRDAKGAAADALSDVRRSVSALRQSEAQFCLREALERLVAGVEDKQLVVDLQWGGDETAYPRSTLMALYRAAQEGLTNIQKHAQANRVGLIVELGQHEARLRLCDDGRGFNPDFLQPGGKTDQPGFGLYGMRERLELLRGRLDLQSSPKVGTELIIIVPRNPFDLETGHEVSS